MPDLKVLFMSGYTSNVVRVTTRRGRRPLPREALPPAGTMGTRSTKRSTAQPGSPNGQGISTASEPSAASPKGAWRDDLSVGADRERRADARPAVPLAADDGPDVAHSDTGIPVSRASAP